MSKFGKKIMVANMLASISLCMSVAAANSRCVFIFHQPKIPEGVKNLRKL